MQVTSPCLLVLVLLLSQAGLSSPDRPASQAWTRFSSASAGPDSSISSIIDTSSTTADGSGSGDSNNGRSTTGRSRDGESSTGSSSGSSSSRANDSHDLGSTPILSRRRLQQGDGLSPGRRVQACINRGFELKPATWRDGLSQHSRWGC